jgi:hypothetical protein
MSMDGVAVDTVFFQPVRLTEETLEGIIRTAAPAIFPGYDYYDFRPAIPCGASTRHPDGALLARGERKWWVVEVETHLHSVSEHIEPQLQDLASGFYGPDAFRYLDRHPTFDPDAYDVDTFDPGFLLVIDSLTPQIRDAANRTGFQTVECSPFRSARNEYALTISGHRPRRGISAAGPGLSLSLTEDRGIAILRPLGGGPVPRLRSNDVVIGDVVHSARLLSDRSGLVLPLTPTELRDLLPGAEHFRLTSAGQLYATTA